MATKKSPSKEKFENLLARLEEIVQKLEQGDLELEESLAAFEEGVSLSRQLADRLNKAEERIEKLIRSTEGQLTAVPLDEVEPEDDDRL